MAAERAPRCPIHHIPMNRLGPGGRTVICPACAGSIRTPRNPEPLQLTKAEREALQPHLKQFKTYTQSGQFQSDMADRRGQLEFFQAELPRRLADLAESDVEDFVSRLWAALRLLLKLLEILCQVELLLQDRLINGQERFQNKLKIGGVKLSVFGRRSCRGRLVPFLVSHWLASANIKRVADEGVPVRP